MPNAKNARSAWQHATERHRLWSVKARIPFYLFSEVYKEDNVAEKLKHISHVFSARRCVPVFRYHYLVHSAPVDDPENSSVEDVYCKNNELTGFVNLCLGKKISSKGINDLIDVGAYQLLSCLLTEYKNHGYTLNSYMRLLRVVSDSFYSAEWSRAFESISDRREYTLGLLFQYCDALCDGGGLSGLNLSEGDFLRLPVEWQWEMLSSNDNESENHVGCERRESRV